jgi:hypothetical protein
MQLRWGRKGRAVERHQQEHHWCEHEKDDRRATTTPIASDAKTKAFGTQRSVDAVKPSAIVRAAVTVPEAAACVAAEVASSFHEKVSRFALQRTARTAARSRWATNAML